MQSRYAASTITANIYNLKSEFNIRPAVKFRLTASNMQRSLILAYKIRSETSIRFF